MTRLKKQGNVERGYGDEWGESDCILRMEQSSPGGYGGMCRNNGILQMTERVLAFSQR